ncbi:MAG: restriction endonuclease subunit S [Mesorhizobium sp.]|nr:MAG: restriction endonuclease subunit S [Mesorhizobium sp.]
MSHSAYLHYADSGSNWLGAIPSLWSCVPLWAAATCNDEVLPENTAPDEAIQYVEISGVLAGQGIREVTDYTFEAAPSRARRRVRDGDVLISTVRTYLRAIAPVVSPPPNMIVSTGFAVLRPKKISAAYLGYAVQAEYFISEVIARSVGISYPAINASDLMRVTIPLPPPREQTAIAAFLDRETAKIDALVDEQKRLIELLKEKRQAVISHAVTKGLDPDAPMKDSGVEWLGEVPADWEIRRLASLFREVGEPGNDELPILSVSIHHGVSDKELDEDDLERKVSRSDDRSKYKQVQPGDLVYNMMRAWQGGFGSVQTIGMVSPAYVVARPKTEFATGFIEALLRTPAAVEEMRRRSRGVTDFRLRLYWEEFKDLRVALPPVGEQRRLMGHVAEHNARSQALIAESAHLIELLNERRAALVSAAATGKIDVRDVAQDDMEAA